MEAAAVEAAVVEAAVVEAVVVVVVVVVEAVVVEAAVVEAVVVVAVAAGPAILGNFDAPSATPLSRPPGYGVQSFVGQPAFLSYAVDSTTAASPRRYHRHRAAKHKPRPVHVPVFSDPLMSSFPAGAERGILETTVAYDGNPLNVLVALSFNVQPIISSSLSPRSIPKRVRRQPASPMGFLRAKVLSIATAWSSTTIQPLAGLTTGTTMTQQASVVFDTNAPLATESAVEHHRRRD